MDVGCRRIQTRVSWDIPWAIGTATRSSSRASASTTGRGSMPRAIRTASRCESRNASAVPISDISRLRRRSRTRRRTPGPWTVVLKAELAPDTELLEYVCNENEKSRQHLVGTASDDLKNSVKVAPEVLARYVGTYEGRLPVNPTPI